MDRTQIREVAVTNITNGGYTAKIMKADRLVGDKTHGLPPGRSVLAIPIHCLPGAPDSWVKDPGTYVIEVDAEHGIWFDWRENDVFNTAIVPTVKGINPITGLKTEDVGMHQYREKCPIHNETFAHELFCEKCGYHWPAQNYVSHPNILWWDGFRQPDGTVRQFFFTEEDQRDVASAIIGKENTIPAFGFAFYRCKNERRPAMDNLRSQMGVIDSISMSNTSGQYHPQTDYTISSSSSSSSTSTSSSDVYIKQCTFNKTSSPRGISGYSGYKGIPGVKGTVGKPGGITGISGPTGSVGVTGSAGITGVAGNAFVSDASVYYSSTRPIGSDVGARNEKFKAETKSDRVDKDVSIGAGAKIRQVLEIDKTPLNEWGENPESVITLYFVFSEQLEKIIEKGGVKKLESQIDGYLKDVVKVG